MTLLVAVALGFSFVTPATAAGPARAATTKATSKIDKRVTAAFEKATSVQFVVQVRGKADLGSVPDKGPRAARGAAVLKIKKAFAQKSQQGVRTLLTARRAKFTSYWIANLIEVTGDQSLADALAARSDVVAVLPVTRRQLPKPSPEQERAKMNNVEWNIAQIRADRVWSDFSDTGAGIVVANIDSGVEYTHPALVNQYRGNEGDGQFDHNYNWFDPTGLCGDPQQGPCDTAGHGTHTMGTMIGDDGQGNQIGVAPGAKWIAAKGCEYNSCEDTSLLAAGQWVIAPTDLTGQNPRPDRAPDVVNNSWGSRPDDPWYQEMVDAWVAAGIFPVFSIGNNGESGCDTAESPGDYPNAYASGAYDAAGRIASFSGRGPGRGDEIKPNIAAPGVQVRSSLPGGQYESWDGTSMAAPHVAGVVALLWSVAPTLKGDITHTRDLLDATAVDTPGGCGGTEANNNSFGQGKLDAFAAVERAPRGSTGTLSGTVLSEGDPVADALVNVTGPWTTSLRTDAEGRYTFRHLLVGVYTVSVTKFGYRSRSAEVTVTEDGTTVHDFDLPAVSTHRLSGRVTEVDGTPVAGAQITIVDTPIPASATDADGRYAFENVPAGAYDLRVDFGRWLQPVTEHVVIDGNTVLDVVLPPKTDAYGYQVFPGRPDWVDTPTVLPLQDSFNAIKVDLPFPFTFYGKTYTSANVSTGGYLTFEGEAFSELNTHIPSVAMPNAAIYAFWDDLFVDDSASVRTGVTGTGTNRRFAIEWRNVNMGTQPGLRVNVEAVIGETGRITVQYSGIDPAQPLAAGAAATVGIENADGTDALEYSGFRPDLSNDVAATFRVPDSGVLRGRVIDANDHEAVAGATVVAASSGRTWPTQTDKTGAYQLLLPFNSYTVSVSGQGYVSTRVPVTVGSETVVMKDFTLKAPRLTADPQTVQIVAPTGERRTRTVTLHNTGTATATWEAKETDGGFLSTGTARAATTAVTVGDPQARTSQTVRRSPPASTHAPVGTAGAGDVLKSWSVNDLTNGWGAGFDGRVWVSGFGQKLNARYTTDGLFTGFVPFSGGVWGADLALERTRGLMCQVTVGGDDNIRCLNRNDGTVAATISGPWNRVAQRGLAYRADDDSFYVGGWNQGIIYHIKGLSHPDAGAVISQCAPADWAISGLAYSPRGILWMVGNEERQQVTGLNPDTCVAQQSLPFPDPNPFSSAGLEIDNTGDLWAIGQDPFTGGLSQAYLIDSGLPSFTDVPWVSEAPASGSIAVGDSEHLRITVDTSGLTPGVYGAVVHVTSDSPRKSRLAVPVKVVVPKYQNAVDVGSTSSGIDSDQDTWGPDQAFSTGSYGYLGATSAISTSEWIAGTPDPWLYATARIGPYEYRFDNVPNGTYQVDLDFAELTDLDPDSRVFDVVVERQIVLPGFDIVGENGNLNAVRQSFTVPVKDGQLNVRLLSRRNKTLINAVRVTERPDLVADS